MGISLKMNVIEWLEFKFTYNNVAVHHINPYATGIACIKE